ncbi:MAG: YceI family protein [Gammaproteobacteria bacterium]
MGIQVEKFDTIKRHGWAALLGLSLLFVVGLNEVRAADKYIIDTKGAHAFIQFKIQHLGFSWLLGQFNTFEGSFVLDDKNPEKSSVNVTIDVSSLDSNHAERDKHLRSEEFFNVSKFPKATFVSKRIEGLDKKSGKAQIIGDFTLKGVTREVTLAAEYVGGGSDPWGGYRQGFAATTEIRLKDFGIDYDLGPASQVAQVHLYVEGIRM